MSLKQFLLTLNLGMQFGIFIYFSQALTAKLFSAPYQRTLSTETIPEITQTTIIIALIAVTATLVLLKRVVKTKN